MRPRVALLTGEGFGAVAVVGVWGVGAVACVDSVFRPHRGLPLAKTEPGCPRVGRLGDGTGDEVVALIVPGHVPEVEVQCHGGPAAIETVVRTIIAAGADRASARGWVKHSSRSHTQAEATLDLPHAITIRAASLLLDQADGALDRALRLIVDSLDSDPSDALAAIDALLATAPVGTRLVEGWRVVLAGRPNVGKSRLLNTLLGYDRAIVDPTPGTTRDVVAARAAFDGWPVELSDTAGLRATVDPIETEGVARARATQKAAELVLLVLDRSRPLDDDDHRLFAEHPTALIVANKSDLPLAWDGIGLVVSAERGDGIDLLAAEIGRRLVPMPPPSGSALIFRQHHVRRLSLIATMIRRGNPERGARVLARWIRTSRADGP